MTQNWYANTANGIARGGGTEYAAALGAPAQRAAIEAIGQRLTPDWAAGMMRVSTGVYTAPDGQVRFAPAEICAELGAPATAFNCAALDELFLKNLLAEIGFLPETVIETSIEDER